MSRYCPYCQKLIPGNHHVCNCEGQHYGQAKRSNTCRNCGDWISGSLTYCNYCIECSSCYNIFNSRTEGYGSQCNNCSFTLCENCGTKVLIGITHCNNCKCILCDNLKIYGKNYCEDCKCSDYYCDNPKQDGKYYCPYHES